MNGNGEVCVTAGAEDRQVPGVGIDQRDLSQAERKDSVWVVEVGVVEQEERERGRRFPKFTADEGE